MTLPSVGGVSWSSVPERRLAAAGLPDNREDLAGEDVEVDAVDRVDRADVATQDAAEDREVLLEAPDRDKGLTGRADHVGGCNLAQRRDRRSQPTCLGDELLGDLSLVRGVTRGEPRDSSEEVPEQGHAEDQEERRERVHPEGDIAATGGGEGIARGDSGAGDRRFTGNRRCDGGGRCGCECGAWRRTHGG